MRQPAKFLAAQYVHTTPIINHIYDHNGNKMTIDKLLAGPHADTRWNPALSNEWGKTEKRQ